MKYLKIFLDDYRIRFPSYLSIWLIYLYYMSNASLRGIDWLPYQEARVRNAVDHIINNSSFIKFGVTSWLPLESASENTIYVAKAHEYIHYLALMKLGGNNVFSLLAPHIDKISLYENNSSRFFVIV